MCHVFRFGSSEAYNLVVSADGVLVCYGVRLGSRPPPGKTRGHLPRKSSDAGLGIELRRVPKGGAYFGPMFEPTRLARIMGAYLVSVFLGPEMTALSGHVFFTVLNAFPKPTNGQKSHRS